MVNVRVTQQIVVDDVALLNEVTTLEAEGLDRFQIELAPAAADVELSLVTGILDDIELFAVKADEYEEGAVPVITYKIHSAGGDPITLNKPIVLNGSGIAALLIDPLDKIFLSNSGLVAKVVTIIIGRHVTP